MTKAVKQLFQKDSNKQAITQTLNTNGKQEVSAKNPEDIKKNAKETLRAKKYSN